MTKGSVIRVGEGLGMNTHTHTHTTLRKPNFPNLYRCLYSHGTFFFFFPSYSVVGFFLLKKG